MFGCQSPDAALQADKCLRVPAHGRVNHVLWGRTANQHTARFKLVAPPPTSKRSLWEEARDVLETQDAGMPLSDIVDKLA
jgi:hypothetical protein